MLRNIKRVAILSIKKDLSYEVEYKNKFLVYFSIPSSHKRIGFLLETLKKDLSYEIEYKNLIKEFNFKRAEEKLYISSLNVFLHIQKFELCHL